MADNKYILIISEASEKSTDEVLQYLHYYNAPFIRLNDKDFAHKVNIILGREDSIQLTFDHCIVSLVHVGFVWYRRGWLRLVSHTVDVPLNDEEQESYKQYYEFYNRELSAVYDFLYQEMKSVRHINNYQDNKISKLNQLAVAKRSGFAIPETLVTNSFKSIELQTKIKPQILKAMNFPVFSVKGQAGTVRYASNSSVLLHENALPNLSAKYSSDNGLLTLMQGYVEKKFEIRTFYLSGKCFSMAIFSQENEKTKIDFRNYDDEKPNRNVPFQLPEDIESNIVRFMKEMDMDCGSLDIIYTPDKQYIFLEVNPVGQFDWLSKECNYFIEEHLAKEMINGLEQAI